MPDWTGFTYYNQINGLFTPAECATIVGYHARTGEMEALIEDETGRIRDSSVFWLYPDHATQWAFDRIAGAIRSWNAAYGFEIADPESLQLTRYGPGQHYGWHMDLGPGPMSRRKISFVLGLNDAYEGGGLEIYYGKPVNPVLRLNPGDCAIFPSFVMHRALPITAGTRWSLVSWVLGEEPLR